MKNKIGVFDSGMGGTTILNAIKKVLPNEEYFYIADSKNCPYGEKSDQELLEIVTKNVEKLKNWGAKIIVIACNTATVKCIETLRKKYPDLTFIGTEPAIRLAANTNKEKILVLATPGTIHSERAEKLLRENQKENQEITLLSCPGLADTIEHTLHFDQVYHPLPLSTTDSKIITDTLANLLKDIDKNQDVVVLGCTHYSLIKPEIQQFFPTSILVDGANGVANRVADIIKTCYNTTNE